MELYPRLKPGIGTQFFLSLIYNGREEDGCSAQFNIMDSNDEKIYYLLFRVSVPGKKKRTIIQNSKINGKWVGAENSNMPYPENVNEVFVEITPEKYYKVTWNGEVIMEQFPASIERMETFQKLVLRQGSSCLIYDLGRSYIRDIQLLGKLRELGVRMTKSTLLLFMIIRNQLFGFLNFAFFLNCRTYWTPMSFCGSRKST